MNAVRDESEMRGKSKSGPSRKRGQDTTEDADAVGDRDRGPSWRLLISVGNSIDFVSIRYVLSDSSYANIAPPVRFSTPQCANFRRFALVCSGFTLVCGVRVMSSIMHFQIFS